MSPLLSVTNLTKSYGALKVTQDVNLDVQDGELRAIIGPNGAGKTTLINQLSGMATSSAGRVLFDGQDISELPATDRVRRGIAISPEGRRLFKDLSVEDNLRVGGVIHPASVFKQDRDRVLSLFPRLGERLTSLAGNLSGGEQQMLAIGRALMARPRFMMIDELSLGLMPKVIDLCYQALLKLRAEGMTVLLVEQNTERVLSVADDVCVLESGQTVWKGAAADARNDPALAAAFLGLH